MEFFFADPNVERMPPKEVRLLNLVAEPDSDGKRGRESITGIGTWKIWSTEGRKQSRLKKSETASRSSKKSIEKSCMLPCRFPMRGNYTTCEVILIL